MAAEASLEGLVEALRRLPGVGVKSAQRMAFHLLDKDRDGLTKPKAFVVLQDAAKQQDADTVKELLRTHVKERIGVWKYPRWIEFPDALPKTATGKIQRYRLREAV